MPAHLFPRIVWRMFRRLPGPRRRHGPDGRAAPSGRRATWVSSHTLSAAVALVVLVLVVSGCGGSSSASSTTTTEMSATQAWAQDVCTALVSWKRQVDSAGRTLKEQPSRDTAQRAANELQSATQELSGAVQSAGRPSVPAAKQAQATLDQLRTQLRGDTADIRDAVASVSSAADLVGAATKAKSGVLAMREHVQSAQQSLRSLPHGELSQAIADAPACATLRGGEAGSS
jgi:hypothetical protein